MADTGNKPKRGRPAGSRNKSKLIRAQLAFDDASELAAETLVSIMKNDTDKLNCSDDVPMTIRLQACKLILDKAIANEKDKLDKPAEETDKTSEKASTGPRVVPRAIG